MPLNLKYSCCVSYRLGEELLMTGFIKQFTEALKAELEARTPLKLWVDIDRFSAGTRIDSTTAQAICQSACMVVIYTPPYFSDDRDSLYCVREFIAIKEIEKIRHGVRPLQTQSIVIPVILRGKEQFPHAIFGNDGSILWSDFEKFDLGRTRIISHPHFKPEIRKIAAHICEVINAYADFDVCSECLRFDFPDPEKAKSWLKENESALKNGNNKFPLS
jgi:hypothetical protein